MPVKAEYKLTGLDKAIHDLVKGGGNLREYMPVVAEILNSAVMDTFEEEAGFTTGAWEESERVADSGGKILQDTGILAGTMATELTAFSARVSPTAPYGIFHVTGTENMPKRNFLDIDWGSVTKEVEDFLLGEILQ